MGYQVNTLARSLRTGTTGLVGVVAPDVANPFISQFLRGAEDVLHASGRMLMIAESHDDSETLEGVLHQMVTRRLDAVIVTAARRGDEANLEKAAQSLPVVLAVRSLEGGNLPTVTHDDRLGARFAAEHLVTLGHRRLAQIRGSEDISSFRERAAGFADLVTASGARDVSLPDVASEPTVAQGKELATRLLSLDASQRPSAIFAHNDLLAVGALAAIANLGLRCPEDISVVGYNDSPLTDHLSPALTTVRVPTAEMGATAGRLVTALLAGTPSEETRRLEPELVIRSSTATPQY
jgi:LacI family transcriptional regulator